MPIPRFSHPLLQRASATLAITLIAAWAPRAAEAQTPGQTKLNVSVLTDRVSLGEFGTLIYTITGGDADMPQSIEAEGLEIVHSGNQSRVQLVQGVQTIEVSHFYRFRGNTPGTYTIPPLTATVGRDTHTAPAVEVTIYERDQSAPPDATRPQFARLELPKDEFYVNEIIPFTLTGFARGRNAIDSVTMPDFSHESFVVRRFKEVRTDGAEIGNAFYSSATLPSTVFALREGQYRLGPATLGLRVVDSGGGFGASSFFSRTATREVASNTVNVTVKPLPRDAPGSFTGGVGRFDMVANPSTTDLAVGDPLSVEFVVAGTGNFQTMDAPVFAVPPHDLWRSYDPSKQLDPDEDSDGSSPGRVVFSRVIIPEARVSTLPVFELSYFDPREERYVTLATDPVPITVRPETPGGTSAPAPATDSAAPLAGPSAPPPAPVARSEDMLHIRTRPPRQWLASGDLPKAGPLFYAAQAIFSVAFFTLLAYGLAWRWQRRRLAPPAAPQVLGFREALRRLPSERNSKRRFYLTLSAALDAWRRDQREPPPKLLDVVNRVAERCDLVLYGGLEDAEGPVEPGEAEKLIALIKKLPQP